MRPTIPLSAWYAVARGNTPGVYQNWRAAWRSTRTYPNQLLRTFGIREHAENWILKMWLKDALLTVQPGRQDLNNGIRGNSSKSEKRERKRLEYWGHNIPGKTWTREEIIEGVMQRFEAMKRRDWVRYDMEKTTAEANMRRELEDMRREGIVSEETLDGIAAEMRRETSFTPRYVEINEKEVERRMPKEEFKARRKESPQPQPFGKSDKMRTWKNPALSSEPQYKLPWER